MYIKGNSDGRYVIIEVLWGANQGEMGIYLFSRTTGLG